MTKPEIIIIGGGIAGASIAWQLSKRGKQVLILERDLPGSGSTGRAAGLLGQLRGSPAATEMLIESLRIVNEVEAKIDAQLFVRTGSFRLALTENRVEQTRRQVEMGRELGLEIELLEPEQAGRMLPLMQVQDVLAASWCPGDGYLMPSELHAAFLQLARENGAEIRSRAPVQEILLSGTQVRGVRVGDEVLEAEVVVNAAGPWSYLIAEMTGSVLPTCSIGHYYITTNPDERFPVDSLAPCLRDYDNRIYSRPEVGGLLVGMYESEPTTYNMEDLPSDFQMSSLTVARDNLNLAQLREAAIHRFPFIEQVSFQVTHGIMTFTPDAQPFCGFLPDVTGLFHCAGFSGHGIVQGPAIGEIVAEIITDGRSRYDVARLLADRFYDAGLNSRAVIREKGLQMYAGYYGGRTAD